MTDPLAQASGPDEASRKDFREYLALVRRRRWSILAVTAVLASIALVVAISLPPVYRSKATIQVQEQEVPPELVRSTITSFADERIHVISQQVMTRAVLLQLVEKYDLYGVQRQRETSDDIVERMRRDIKLSTIDAGISDRASGRRVNATIAFQISFDSPMPDDAQNVVNELVSLYLSQNIKVRQQSVAETTAFLAQESDRLAKQIRDIETNLAAFKRRNVGRLPDSMVVNMQLAERTDAELQRVDREIVSQQEKAQSLETQLLIIKPNHPLPDKTAEERVQTPAERLRALRSQYASTSSVYGADHPDIRRMRREMAALKAEAGDAGNESESAAQLKDLEAELATLKERYSDDHPDVQRVRRSIAALKASAGGESAASRAADKRGVTARTQPPDNPAYITLSAQLESAKREVVQLLALRDELRLKQRTYDSRLLQIPGVEREYQELTRDYDNAQARYRETKAKQMQAELAQELELDRKAERFSIVEPANLPETPISPNRMQIVFLGFIGSLGGGLGLAWLREVFDPSVKGPVELARIAPAPILTAIPYIETRQDRVGQVRRIGVAIALIAGLGIGLVLAIHFYLRPIGSLAAAVVRRFAPW